MLYNFIFKYFLLHEWNFIILKDANIFIDIIMYVWCEYLYFLLFQQIYLMLISKLNKRLICSPCFFHIFSILPFYHSNVGYLTLNITMRTLSLHLLQTLKRTSTPRERWTLCTKRNASRTKRNALIWSTFYYLQ